MGVLWCTCFIKNATYKHYFWYFEGKNLRKTFQQDLYLHYFFLKPCCVCLKLLKYCFWFCLKYESTSGKLSIFRKFLYYSYNIMPMIIIKLCWSWYNHQLFSIILHIGWSYELTWDPLDFVKPFYMILIEYTSKVPSGRQNAFRKAVGRTIIKFLASSSN